ncbi:MAG: TIGR02270 family protein [Comamonadaceae bacterium]|nr:MAG: TIGR02270 family protein [Comamonadaceae bacterium]
MRPPIPFVIQQHAEDAVVLRNTRSLLVRAPHVKLHQLARLDERLAGHLDGLAVAGEQGARIASAALDTPGSAEVFVAAACAIERRDPVGLERLFALAQAMPELQPGLISAFGWVPGASLQGITRALLDSPGALQREVGLCACVMHGIDPGAALDAALADKAPTLRARALRISAQLGDVARLPACMAAMAGDDEACAAEAAHAAVLLGGGEHALAALHALAVAQVPHQARALSLLLAVLPPLEGRAVLTTLAQDATLARPLIRGIGVAGDAHFLPWLVRQMHDKALARIAGESFSLITGLDLALLDLERDAPADAELGPNDDPADGDTAMDADDGLPWPDPEQLHAWCEGKDGQRFVPGLRYFMGELPTPAHCVQVLQSGFQRQRSAAALHLRLLRPGHLLFNTAAPAARQRAALIAMGA